MVYLVEELELNESLDELCKKRIVYYEVGEEKRISSRSRIM